MHHINFTYVKNIEFDIEISIIYCNNFEYILFKKKKTIDTMHYDLTHIHYH